jgi:hypothetical protein
MIYLGENDAHKVALEVKQKDRFEYYEVELCRVALPHLPIRDKVIRDLKLSKQELVGYFQEGTKLTGIAAFKLASLWTSYREGYQVLYGKIRSCGIGRNFKTHLRDVLHASEQPRLTFKLQHTPSDIVPSKEHPGAFEINRIASFSVLIL